MMTKNDKLVKKAMKKIMAAMPPLSAPVRIVSRELLAIFIVFPRSYVKNTKSAIKYMTSKETANHVGSMFSMGDTSIVAQVQKS